MRARYTEMLSILESGSGEVDVLENAGRVPHGGDALLRMQAPLLVDEDGLARRDVAHEAERLHVQCNALGGQHPLGAARRRSLSQHERADPVRIAETENAMPDDHRNDRITSAAAAIDGVDGCEYVGGSDPRSTDALQLGREDVQQHFRVGSGVEMPPVLTNDHLGKLGGIGEIAVVRQTDAIGRIDVEGLCFRSTFASGRRIADVSDARVPFELQHVLLLKYVAHQSTALAHIQFAVSGGGDACGILSAVLQYSQRIVDPLIDCAGSDDADNSTHV